MYRNASTCLNAPKSRSRAWSQEGPEAVSLDGATTGRLESLSPRSDGLRLDLIARVRREIAAGTYDTPDKMEIALERLLQRLDRD